MRRHSVILISGAPGAGKTTLATALAERLGFALVSKDLIKEILHDSLGGADVDPTWSTKLGQAAMDVLWNLASIIPQVVLDANFRPGSEELTRNLAALGPYVAEVHCSCPPKEAMRRYNSRAATRHAVHVPARLPLSYFFQYDSPITDSAALIVDTTREVDIEWLVDGLDAHFG